MDNKTLLIIISGPSGVGKTTLAKNISKKFNLPLIYKDGFKEILFDKFGVKDSEWSQKLGSISYDFIHHTTKQLLKSKVSHIVEAPFDPKFENKKFKELLNEFSFIPIQVLLRADKNIIYQRMKARAVNGERHPGHMFDFMITKSDIHMIQEQYEPLDIGGEIYNIDTSDFDNVDFNTLFKKIELLLDNKK